MKRQPSAAVIVTAILLAVCGFLILVAEGSLLSLVVRNRPWMTPGQVLRRNPAPFARMLTGAAWLSITGVGVYRVKAWARISLLTLSLLVICFGGFLVLAGYVWLGASPSIGDVTLLAASAMIPAAGLLVLFTRKGISDQFTGGQERPVSVAMLGGFFLASTMFVEMVLTGHSPMHPSYFIIGIPFHGFPALVILALWLMLLVVLGVALLKWRAWARIPSAIYASLYLVDCAYAFLPGRAERFAASVPITPGPHPKLAALTLLVKAISLWFAAWATVALWILADNWSEFGRIPETVHDTSAEHGEEGEAA